MLVLLANEPNGGFMERVYKTFTGGYSKEKDGKEATHVILTVEEYNKLIRDLRDAQNDKRRAEDKAERDIRDYKAKANNIIREEREANQKSLEALESDLKGARVEIDRLNDLNANLNRIMRERANAKRGLKPKKEHHGYLVIDSQQYKYTHWSKGKSLDLNCWKVRIQSPYDSSIPYDTIVKDITNDLIELIGSELGLKKSFGDLKKFSYNEVQELWENDFNFIFRTSYKSNVKGGFWEVEYLVKSSIIVPESMRIA